MTKKLSRVGGRGFLSLPSPLYNTVTRFGIYILFDYNQNNRVYIFCTLKNETKFFLILSMLYSVNGFIKSSLCPCISRYIIVIGIAYRTVLSTLLILVIGWNRAHAISRVICQKKKRKNLVYCHFFFTLHPGFKPFVRVDSEGEIPRRVFELSGIFVSEVIP